MTDTPKRAERFALAGWQADETKPAIHFHFTCSRFGAFRETVAWPTLESALTDHIDEGLAGLIDLLHAALGVSYYKCAAAYRLALPGDLGLEAREMAGSLYTDGLAEFYVRAGLPWPTDLRFEFEGKRHQPHQGGAASFPQIADALVAFGGGKDSYVAERIVEQAGISWAASSSVMSDKVANTIQGTSVTPVHFMRRTLDPKIREVNAVPPEEGGAFNGHVPITAINSLMLVILGRLTGARYAIFANERSADEPTMELGGLSANHQYSKSSFFEEKLRAAIHAADPGAPDYFSILRPWSEIWIARAFAGTTLPKVKFTSCNRNFQITGDDSPRWCGDCAKCAFTSLMLAPHMPRHEAEAIFPALFPDKKDLIPVYRELLGLTETKPWDCVGTIDECRATLYQISLMADWKDVAVVRALLPDVLARNTPAELQAFWDDGLREAPRHFVPEKFLEAARAL
ncbi:hypothetical protein [Aquisalinus flavus]|uniref:UDP-N-acetyl-alpha-D-muramoyl-L-alanyl-L-glutamate epimerase n=1 Tax=Aquisalinus flavus TaxID=1526572 RepID=A0A8J2Y6C1_9PROT|nr:hypothetical protein [Aquisalinus flavus]MBD0426413.1 hypothetical protein [Aquisalinus flavus]UNE48031.1 hypothetical protein FF099_08200 [Aquisalinus flavus]GGD08108.1 hypothetical protein GCM10011342_16230 [Aquisalinus flavus]